jgi:hypothetical protein
MKKIIRHNEYPVNPVYPVKNTKTKGTQNKKISVFLDFIA